MVSGKDAGRNCHIVWRSPPWTVESAPWQDIDQRLGRDHLARLIHAFVLSLDLQALRQTYLGVGKPPFPPERMLMVVLYEMHKGQLHPCRWAEDCKFSDPVKWLALGLQPSASYFYSFRQRLKPEEVKSWNQQLVRRALAKGRTMADEASLDGTFVAALGSRHHLLKAKTLGQRVQALRQALAEDGRAARRPAPVTVTGGGADLPLVPPNMLPEPRPTARAAAQATAVPVPDSPPKAPYWMATTPRGRGRQLHRFRQAQQHLDQLLAHHAQCENRKAKRKRRRPDQVRICPSEPGAALGRDKLKTFRPLYNVQLVSALEVPLILEYGVHATTTDAGLFIPTVQALTETLGKPPQKILVDGIYATAANLAHSEEQQITMYAPVTDQHAAAAGDGKAGATTKAKQLGKEQFRWDAAEQTYYCPEGHRLLPIGCKAEKREQDQEVLVYQYRCPPQHCQTCPQAAQCTPAPHKGRTIKRSEHEDKVEALRQRMRTPEGEALYKKRGQTIEPRIGDLKAHRGLRCFTAFGKALALVQVGLLVLVHNALCLLKPESAQPQSPARDASREQAAAPPTASRPASPGFQGTFPEVPP